MAEDTNSPEFSPIRIIVIGSAIGMGAIALFGLLWVGLGQIDVSTTVRLVTAICVPPAIMTVITIWLYLTRGRQI
ncbi:MAG: hypothetical protein AAF787_06690 [Chloroflexota bacterium]